MKTNNEVEYALFLKFLEAYEAFDNFINNVIHDSGLKEKKAWGKIEVTFAIRSTRIVDRAFSWNESPFPANGAGRYWEEVDRQWKSLLSKWIEYIGNIEKEDGIEQPIFLGNTVRDQDQIAATRYVQQSNWQSATNAHTSGIDPITPPYWGDINSWVDNTKKK